MTETARTCGFCRRPLSGDADPRRRYCDEECQSDARNDHRRAMTAWKRSKREQDAHRVVERRGQLSLDPRPLDDLLPALPPMPTRDGGAS